MLVHGGCVGPQLVSCFLGPGGRTIVGPNSDHLPASEWCACGPGQFPAPQIPDPGMKGRHHRTPQLLFACLASVNMGSVNR